MQLNYTCNRQLHQTVLLTWECFVEHFTFLSEFCKTHCLNSKNKCNEGNKQTKNVFSSFVVPETCLICMKAYEKGGPSVINLSFYKDFQRFQSLFFKLFDGIQGSFNH